VISTTWRSDKKKSSGVGIGTGIVWLRHHDLAFPRSSCWLQPLELTADPKIHVGGHGPEWSSVAY